MNEQDLQAIKAGNVEDVAKAVADMGSAEDLTALLALEKADNSPRKTVIDAIEKRVAELDEAAKAPPPAQPPKQQPQQEPTASAKPAPAAAPTTAAPWKQRDYTGPLTGDQAAWRNAHIKPVAEARKK